MLFSLCRRHAVPAVAVSAAAALVLGASSPASATAYHRSGPPTTHGIAQGAAGWLDQQLVGGTHVVGEFGSTKYIDYGNTLGVAFALAAAKVGKRSISAAVNYVGHHLAAYAGFGSSYGVSDGALAKTALAAIVAGRDPNHFFGHHLLTALKSHESANGNNRNVYSSVSISLITLAEARGARHDGAKFAPSAAQRRFLLLQQCANGGFSSTVRTSRTDACKADVDATGYALMALQALGGHGAAIKKAGRWLVSKRRPGGAWNSQGGHDTDSTALAISGLHVAGRAIGKSVAWLRKQQVHSGPTAGRAATRGALRYQGSFDPTGSLFATVDGVLGLRGASLATISAKHATKRAPVLALAAPSLAKRSVRSGSSDKATGRGFAAHERVIVRVGAAKVGTGKTNGRGTVTIKFAVPKSLSHTKHHVVLTGHRSGLFAHGSLVVK